MKTIFRSQYGTPESKITDNDISMAGGSGNERFSAFSDMELPARLYYSKCAGNGHQRVIRQRYYVHVLQLLVRLSTSFGL